MAISLPLDTLMRWESPVKTISPTDHARSELSVSAQPIDHSSRMIDGTMRKYHVADKRTFSCSWDMLPATGDEIVDGKAGGREIEEFFQTTKGPFTLHLTHADSNLNYSVEVMFVGGLEKAHQKRGVADFWNISVTMEEV